VNAVPGPSASALWLRTARERDPLQADGISALQPAEVRSALYQLASDPDPVIHRKVQAAVAAQQVAADPSPEGVTAWDCGGCRRTQVSVKPEGGRCASCGAPGAEAAA
jgi:hypothetical protein